MNRKLVVGGAALVLTVASVFFLWKQPVLLSVILLLIAYGKHRLSPIRLELLWFTAVCVISAVIEIILVNFSHTWGYPDPQFWNVPLWMPFYWGVIGTTIVTMYDGVTNRPE